MSPLLNAESAVGNGESGWSFFYINPRFAAPIPHVPIILLANQATTRLKSPNRCE
jgi:hypothetical protein